VPVPNKTRRRLATGKETDLLHKSTTILCLVLCLLFLCGASVTVAETPNEKTVREVFAAIDAGNVDRIRELVREDLVLRSLDGTQSFSRDVLLQATKEYYAAFPDNTHVIVQTVAAGDLVAVMAVCHATSKGPFEGAAPTGQPVTFGTMKFLRFQDGRVREWWGLADDLGLMRQLGMELAPRLRK
jgi:predicted ester cyclase